MPAPVCSEKRSFNADFYVAAATVIPALFLAIAVQGTIYENLLKAIAAAIRRVVEQRREPTRPTTPSETRHTLPGSFAHLVIMLIPMCVAIGIVGFGVIGEVGPTVRHTEAGRRKQAAELLPSAHRVYHYSRVPKCRAWAAA